MGPLTVYVYIVFNYFVELAVLGFVPTKSSTIRFSATILHTIVCVVIHQNSSHTANGIYDVMLAIAFGSLNALRMMYYFILFPKSYLNNDGSFDKRINYANSIIWNPRMIGHPERVRNVPEWGSRRTPTKKKFLISKITWLAILYIIADALTSNVPTDESRQKLQVLCAQENEWLFRIPTFKEFKIRFIMTFIFWVIIYVAVNLYLHSLDFIYVILGLVDVGTCRPQFGPISEMYSIRKFWGVFWHQNLRHEITVYSELLAKMLPVKNRLFQRYFKIVTAFAISGAVHEIAHVLVTNRSFHLTTVFFILCGLGIMVEDFVQHIYKSIVPTESKTPVWVERLVGYCWVVLFMVWATPLWSYNMNRNNKGMYLPVRFINS
jgi:hypothetical protein